MQGLRELLYIKIENKWLPVACLTDNPISESTNLIPTTTRQNNGWESFVPGTQSASISFDGVVDYSKEGKADYYKIREIKREKTLIEWRILNHLNGDIDYGWGYINELSKASPADSLITFSGTITVNNKPESTNIFLEPEFAPGFPYVITNLTP